MYTNTQSHTRTPRTHTNTYRRLMLIHMFSCCSLNCGCEL